MERTPGKTKEERAAHWSKIIQEARSYPAGVAAYCNDKKVQKNSYYYWFHRLRPVHPEWKEDLSNSSKVEQTAPSPTVAGETEVVERASRRTLTAAYKKRILKEAAASSKGQVAALLRREGLYTHLN